MLRARNVYILPSCKHHSNCSETVSSTATLEQVTASVETVVGDMKQKHDKAQRQVQDANAGIAQAEADLVLVRQVQYEKMERIKKLCK